MRKSFRLLPALLLAVVPAMACGDNDQPGAPLTTRDLLADAPFFFVANAESTATLHAELDRGSTTEATDVTLAVTLGQVTVAADADRLVTDGLTLAFGDVALPVAIFPSQLVLTGIHVHLATPLDLPATWRDDDEQVTTSGPGELRLDWKVRVDGAVHDLGSQTLSNLGFTVITTHDGERLRTALQVNAHGVMWTWADVVALGDLDLDMVAYTAAE